jgi:hypothetical protein
MKRPDLLSPRLPSRPAVRRATLLPWLCAAGSLLASVGAQAQTSPYYLRLSERLGFDSNIFRVSGGAEQRDYTSTTAITVGIDQPISRQRLYGSATADYTAYKGNDQLNGPGYELIGGLGWEIGSKLAGDARVSLRQVQASLADYGALSSLSRDKNRERSALFDLRGTYGGQNLLALEGLYNHTDISYSNNGFATRERESDTVGAGIRVRPSIDWTYGLTWRETRGEYPRGVVVAGGFSPDEYDRRDIDLSASLRVSAISSFSARLSYTKEDHDQVASRSFSGLTGEIVGSYRPTGKLELGAALSRDTGSGNTPSQLVPGATASGGTTTGTTTGTPVSGGTAGAATGATAGSSASTGYLNDSRVSDRLRVIALWDATAKVRFNGGLTYSRDRYDTLFVVGTTGTLGQEKGSTRGVTLGARYLFSRAVSFECGAGYESRDAGNSVVALKS